MSDREDFDEWAEENHYLTVRYASGEFAYERTNYAFAGWQARQPETDALKAKNDALGRDIRGNIKTIVEFSDENAALRAEVERLHKDAERLAWMEAHPRLGEIHVDGEVKDCYLYAVSGALGVSLRAIIDALMTETK